MTKPYSEDLRERIVRAVDGGKTRTAVAEQFDVSISFVVKLMQRWRSRGTIAADRYGSWVKPTLAPHAERIGALIAATPDITIQELMTALAAEGIKTTRSTLGDFLIKKGYRRKKRLCTRASNNGLM